MKKVIFIVGGIVLLIGALLAALLFAPTNPTNEMSAATNKEPSPSNSTETPKPTANDTATIQAGRYETYEANKVSAEGYERTVIFFYAPWCPECRAFDEAITRSTIPAGVQILQLDYDSATELRKQHEVTLQSTFVEVDANGAQTAKWVGYGKDKSVEAILENL